MELTQEQLDAMLAEKIAEARQGLFDETELQRRVTSEVDKRVESGIQKGVETQKTKWEEDFAAKAKMSAEDLAKQKLQEQMTILSSRESELNVKANLLDAKSELAKASIPDTYYEKFINVIVTEDETVTKQNISNFVEMFNSTKQGIETELKAQLTKVPNPKQGTGKEGVSKEDFGKMQYAERLALKESNPTLYKEFITT